MARSATTVPAEMLEVIVLADSKAWQQIVLLLVKASEVIVVAPGEHNRTPPVDGGANSRRTAQVLTLENGEQAFMKRDLQFHTPRQSSQMCIISHFAKFASAAGILFCILVPSSLFGQQGNEKTFATAG